MRSLPKCILLDFQGLPIFKQLQIEEALLRVADQNFCIFNRAVSDSVVLGISRDPNQDTYLSRLQENNIPVIKRYSGGGTVFIDEDTLMVSWIMNSDQAFEDPQSILSWTYALYAPMFPNTFSIQENDYTLGEKKNWRERSVYPKTPLGAPHNVFVGHESRETRILPSSSEKATKI